MQSKPIRFQKTAAPIPNIGGVFKISSTGIDLLRNPPERIDINYLKRFDAFNEFRKKASRFANATLVAGPLPTFR